MKYKRPTLNANWIAIEGSVRIPPEWSEMCPMVRADLLKDWIADLSQEYNKTLAELFPRKAKAKK